MATERKGLKPHHIVVAFGLAIAVFTALSGILPVITDQSDKSEIKREVFVNVPGPLKLVFYTLVPVVLLYGAVMFSQRVKNWQRGAPDRRATTVKNAKRRFESFRAGVYMQTLLRDPAAGLMHSLIYFSFLILLAVTTILEINHLLPGDWQFLHGTTYKAYALVGDLAGIGLLAGVTWALVRRYVQRPYRIRTKSKSDQLWGLGTLLALAITGFGAEAWRIAVEGRPDFEKFSIVGYPLSALIDGQSHLAGGHQVWWVVHVLSFITFLAILPVTMMRHMFTSPLNMYLSDRDRPKGAMRPMPNLMETELETFGASTVEDFTWKQLLDTDACTMCGRCTSVCPAHATGKPLDPREIVLKVGEVMALSGEPQVRPPINVEPDITVSSNSVFERVTPEEVWACTSCKACDEICPVNIEILDKILDMRRYLSLMESNFPTELGTAYRSMENSGNPWGMSQSDRGSLGQQARRHRDRRRLRGARPGVPLLGRMRRFVRRQEPEGHSGDGKADATSRRGVRHPRPVGELHRRPGPPIRQRVHLPDARHAEHRDAQRHGREEDHHPVPALLQHAHERVPAARRELRGRPPQPVPRVADRPGQARPPRRPARGAGRLPRQLLPRSPQRRVPRAPQRDRPARRHRGRRSRAQRHQGHVLRRRWRSHVDGGDDRHEGERRSSEELIATGASRIATACPFCYIMLDDGVKGAGKEEDEVRVADISMHLLEAIENAEAGRTGGVLETVED